MIEIANAIADDLKSKFPSLEISVTQSQIAIDHNDPIYVIRCENRKIFWLEIFPDCLECTVPGKIIQLRWESPDLFDVIYKILKKL